MHSVQTKLTCINCKQKLHINIKARLLPCLQALCQSCVDSQHGQFSCGYCRNVHMVDNNLPPDSVRKNMITLVEPEQGYTCTNAPDGNLAESFCTDNECQVYLCSTCLRKHESLKMSQNHTLLAVSEMTSMPVYTWKTREMCLRHPKEQLRLYDEGCQMPICFLCRHTDHDGHSCSEIERVYKRESSNLQEKADDLQTKLKTLDEHVEKGKGNADAIAKSRVNILEEIKQSFTIVYDCLKQRENDLIQETQQHFTESVEKNNTFLETLATKGNTLQSTVSYFKDSMKFAAYSEWLSLKPILQNQIILVLDDTVPDLDESSWRIVYVSKGTEDLQKRIKKFGILTDTALTTSKKDTDSDTVDQLKAEDVKNKAHIVELQNRIQSLECQKDCRVELEDLENKLVSEQRRVEDLKASRKQDEDKLSEMTSENTHLQEEKQQILIQLTDAKNKFEEISVQYQQALSDKERMRKETENIQRDHLQLEETLAEVQINDANKRNEILELQEEKRGVEKTLCDAEEKIAEMRTEEKHNQSQKECTQLQESLDQLQKRYEILEEVKTTSEKERQILETKFNKLQQKLESEQEKTRKQIDEMKHQHQNELLERERQREETEDKFNQSQNKCIHLQESLDELRKRYSKLEEEKTSSTKERQLVETKMIKLQQKLESEQEKTQKVCETDEQIEKMKLRHQNELLEREKTEDKFNQSRNKCIQLQESLDELQKRYSKLEEEKTSSNKQRQILETKMNKLQQKLESEQEKTQKLSKANEQIDQMKLRHKNELLERERQREETEDKFNQSQNKCIQLQETLDELKKLYSKLEEEKTSSNKERQILETKMNKLQQKLEWEQEKTQKICKTDEQIDEMKHQHQNELLERERQSKETEVKFSQSQKKCTELQESLDELQKRYSKLEEEKTSSNKERQILETKMNKLQQKLESEQEKTQKLCKTNEQIDQMKLRHKNELLERERQREETEDKFNQSQNKCIQLQETLDELEKLYSKLKEEKTSSNKERQILETKMNKLQQKLEWEQEKTQKICKTDEQIDEMKHQHQNELLERERHRKETEEKFSQSQKKCTELQAGLLDASVVSPEPDPKILKAIARPEMGLDPTTLNRRYVHIKDGYLVNAKTKLKTGDLLGKSMHRGAQARNPIPHKGSVYWETKTLARPNWTVSVMEPLSEVVVAQKDSSDVCQQLSGQKRTASFLVTVCDEHKSVCGILMTEDEETVHTQIIPFQDLSPQSPVTFTNGFLYSRDDNKLVVFDLDKKTVIGFSGKLPALITPVVNVGVFCQGQGEVKVKIVSGDEISWKWDKTCLLEKALHVML